MRLPLSYSLRNIAVRRASAAFTAFGIALTVAVFAGVLSLRAGFESVYQPRGREDLVVYMRQGALSEGESSLSRETVQILKKERPEIARDEDGRPLAAAETFLAVYLELLEGGLINIPLRGVEPASLALHDGALRLVEGRWMQFGSDEIVVGSSLPSRMQDCSLGDTLVLNTTPFKVVGVFEHDGVHGGEIWGDAERMIEALDRVGYQRVLAQVVDGTDVEALATELASDRRVPVQVRSERAYLASQTNILGGALQFLAVFLSVVMGVAAVLGAAITMLASVASRTHEIGVLLAIGYPRGSVFVAFLIEAAGLGVLGGALGLLLVLPFDGIQTGLMNWQTFTDVSFGFRLTPALMARSFGLAFALGVLGGAVPAWLASRKQPVDALSGR